MNYSFYLTMCFEFKKTNTKEFKRIRIVLTSRNFFLLEKFCQSIVNNNNIAGRISKIDKCTRFPVKFLSITTRKSPCGQGTNTWDHFETRIHKRIVDVISGDDVKNHFSTINIEPGIEVEIKFLKMKKK